MPVRTASEQTTPPTEDSDHESHFPPWFPKTISGRFNRQSGQGPASVMLLGFGQPAPTDAIRLAVVGVGSRVKGGRNGAERSPAFPRNPRCPRGRPCATSTAPISVRRWRTSARTTNRWQLTPTYAKLLEDKDVDAIVVTTPNHWHALVTIWACQAGKDVYVQKPASYNIFEGRQMVAAGQEVQPDRSMSQTAHARPTGARKPWSTFGRGTWGASLSIRGLRFGPRGSIGKVSGPQPLPPTVDYDLWSGPAPVAELTRRNLHYDWQLELALRQRRTGKLGHSPAGRLPHGRRRRSAASRDQHRRAFRL